MSPIFYLCLRSLSLFSYFVSCFFLSLPYPLLSFANCMCTRAHVYILWAIVCANKRFLWANKTTKIKVKIECVWILVINEKPHRKQTHAMSKSSTTKNEAQEKQTINRITILQMQCVSVSKSFMRYTMLITSVSTCDNL